MRHFYIYEAATGLVVATRSGDAVVSPDDGFLCREVATEAAARAALGHRHDDGALVPVPPPLDDVRAARWAEARQYREQRMQGGCTTQWGRVDTDADSQRKVGGAVTAALVAKQTGQPFEVNWTMADNAVVALDADALIAVGMAVVAHLAACQDAGTAIRAAIDAAQDGAAVAAVDITTGYPS